MSFAFVKGHGTHNDFVVLPDLDGSIHGDLDPALVRRICDRRGGIGGDGVLRVLRGDADVPWVMDYRNADGSIAEMCGNGVRVFARYLSAAGLVDESAPLRIGTRDGVKRVEFRPDGDVAVDMGVPRVIGPARVGLGDAAYDALAVEMGPPHAVAFVSDLEALGALGESPRLPVETFPAGANVEFAVRGGPRALAMRVHERGVGETQSCGTGACAVVVAAQSLGDAAPGQPYRVDVPGGRLTVTWQADGHVELMGPAELVAAGTWTADD